MLLMVVSGHIFIEKGAEMMKLDPVKETEKLSKRLHEMTGMRLKEETPLSWHSLTTVYRVLKIMVFSERSPVNDGEMRAIRMNQNLVIRLSMPHRYQYDIGPISALQ